MRLVPICSLPLPLRADVAAFLRRHEPFCVQLAAALRRSVEGAFAVLEDGSEDSDGNSFAGLLCGVISFKRTLLLCLPFAESDDLESEAKAAKIRGFSSALSEFLYGVRGGARFGGPLVFPPACVNGCAGGVSLVLGVFSIFGIAPVQTNSYDLMRLDSRKFQARSQVMPEACGKVVRFGKNPPPGEFKSLLELQKAYEVEEVLPPHIPFDEDLCRLRLSHALRTQAVYALRIFSDNPAAAPIFAAKAGTNAEGFNCAQIGGVYTAKEFRRRNYGLAVVRALVCRILHEKKSAVLFVKKENSAALGLYKKLGFQKFADYTIAYFRHNP